MAVILVVLKRILLVAVIFALLFAYCAPVSTSRTTYPSSASPYGPYPSSSHKPSAYPPSSYSPEYAGHYHPTPRPTAYPTSYPHYNPPSSYTPDPSSYAPDHTVYPRPDTQASYGVCDFWQGNWKWDYGPMTITMQGHHLIGKYVNHGYDGTVEGDVKNAPGMPSDCMFFKGTWEEKGAGSTSKGPMTIDMSIDGKSFTGYWNYYSDHEDPGAGVASARILHGYKVS